MLHTHYRYKSLKNNADCYKTSWTILPIIIFLFIHDYDTFEIILQGILIIPISVCGTIRSYTVQ